MFFKGRKEFWLGLRECGHGHSTTNLRNLDIDLQEELERILTQEDLLWQQRASVNFNVHGDRNTAFFHAKAKFNVKRNLVDCIKLDTARWYSDQNILRKKLLSFSSKFILGIRLMANCFLSLVPSLVFMGSLLISWGVKVTSAEIHKALFDMAPAKAPGLDGFNALFYQHNWSVIGPALCEMVQKTFRDGMVDPLINCSVISLIPKIPKPSLFCHLRPISLCNVSYKIINKVIANRLKPLMPLLIHPSQTSFVAGRNIHDNIIVAQEILHSMRNKKGKTGWMAIKIDLEKAYDRLSWSFGYA